MTILIQQRTIHDCSICCLAMALDHTYEEVMEKALESKNFDPARGMFGCEETLKLFGMGYTWHHDGEDNSFPLGDFVEWRKGYEISPQYFRQMAWGRRCLISVPSLNRPDVWHHVYYDGTRVWDPSTAKTYTEYGQLMPRSILMFREGAL